VIFDIIYLISSKTALATASFYVIAAGVAGGLLAALFGFLDWLGLPANSRAKRLGAMHGIGNFVIVVLFALSWLLRLGTGTIPGGLALLLSFLGAACALVTAWLGGEMVYRMGVAVDPEANVNAPSSLSGEPAASSQKSAASR
jgi:uncharacterized membrane protein